jgi:hypothetical protein
VKRKPVNEIYQLLQISDDHEPGDHDGYFDPYMRFDINGKRVYWTKGHEPSVAILEMVAFYDDLHYGGPYGQT